MENEEMHSLHKTMPLWDAFHILHTFAPKIIIVNYSYYNNCKQKQHFKMVLKEKDTSHQCDVPYLLQSFKAGKNYALNYSPNTFST